MTFAVGFFDYVFLRSLAYQLEDPEITTAGLACSTSLQNHAVDQFGLARFLAGNICMVDGCGYCWLPLAGAGNCISLYNLFIHSLHKGALVTVWDCEALKALLCL